ncbi:MAG: D-alanine--poly(phosphoribitol) ligase subunit DltC [Anaerovoracaceae bacterium]
MEEKILDLLEEICEDDIVREELDIDLFEEGLMDSLGYTELLVGIEEAFGIVLAPSEIAREDVATPAQIIELVKARSK